MTETRVAAIRKALTHLQRASDELEEAKAYLYDCEDVEEAGSAASVSKNAVDRAIVQARKAAYR